MRAIPKDAGITEGAIRQKAKKQGWTRNTAALKRERVNARLAGYTQEITQAVERVVDQEVEADVEDMNTALGVYRKILKRLDAEIDLVRGFKSYKIIGEAATVAVNGIRRIRGLDAPLDLGNMSEEQMMALAQGKAPK